MDYRNACAVNKTYARTFSETCESKEHGQCHKAAGHDFHKAVIRECLWEKIPPMPADASEIVMFEIAVAVEVKTDQDCDDFRIGHHALTLTFWSVF